MDRLQWINRINRALDLPLALLSLVMLVLVLVDLLLTVPPETRLWLERINWAIWGAFALEYLVKFSLAPHKRLYLRTHWFDTLVLVVPTFRVVRALRILQVTRAFPVFRLVAFMGMGLRGIRLFFKRHRVGYLAALTLFVTFAGGAAVYLLERHQPGTRFHHYGDALWWSAALLTSIGSDLNPQTGPGRFIAVLMMMYSMVIVVFLTGALAGDFLRGEFATPAPTTRLGEEEAADNPTGPD